MATVADKEQDLIDRVQELKDAAVAAIAEVRANYQPTSLDPTDVGDNQDSMVSSSLGDTNSPGKYIPHEIGENAKGDVKPRPEIMQFCKQMDTKGLLNFTMENQKKLFAIREELSVALESAMEPARLVLDLLEGFYPPAETDQPLDKKDAALQGMRKSCIIFIEAMAALLARTDPGADHLLNPEIKQQAKAIADEWKPNLASVGNDAANANSLEAEAFLQLLATFRIASEFDEEELCKLVLVVSRRRQAPGLCRSLGLSHKVPGLVESLVNSGKQIDAVHFIHAFQLTESFPPVPLLKTYLKDLRRNSQGKGVSSGGATGAQIDVNAQELAALKAVVNCVKEYKLEADYPLDPLQKRVAQLERSKSDKKRGGDFGTAYGGMPERYPQAGPNPYDYQVPGQPAFAQQPTDQRLYFYPQDDRVNERENHSQSLRAIFIFTHSPYPFLSSPNRPGRPHKWLGHLTHILTPMFLFLYLLQSHPAASTATLLHGGSRPPWYCHSTIPLLISSEAVSRILFVTFRDPPSNSHPSARMRLHDDLLLNGYYTTRLWIGTPPQQFALIVDTGSTVTYVPCATCEQCGRHQDPKFEPDLSSTYQPVKCNLDCNCDHDRVQCVYERQYAEMSSSSGVLGEDILSFGNQSELVPQRAVFGCENVETGDLYTQHADGIMGLGRGDLSVVDQLVEKGVISDSFSLCYGGMDIGGGAMVLGDISPPANMVFAHSDPVRRYVLKKFRDGNSPYYNINLKAIHVAGKPLPLNPRVFDGKHGTVLDSGTTYAYLPEAAFVAFKDAIMNELQSLKQIRGPDPNYHDICFSGASSDASQLSNTFPAVEMVFGNGQKLLLSPENYLVPGNIQRFVVDIVWGFSKMVKDPTTLLGGIVVRNTLVMYDREHSKIGFWKTNCSELWEQLQETGTPPQVPSSGKNSSAKLPPNEPSNYALSGVLRIGQITFDMSLSINYSNLEPHIPELTEFIAHELDVNTSQVRQILPMIVGKLFQVHLLNVTSKGDSSLITWAIFPLGSANYISNDTAIGNIISQLAEHRVHLPDTFGNYKLLQWKIKPPAKRRWWQQQYLVAVLAITITMIVGLSAYGIWWFLWRQRQQTVNSYKPVDTAGPEQELQATVNLLGVGLAE
ncbi:hypothetical protein Patl1_28585 [Pistacia atlantica]|uniref:Uncharacterized protein n=1 Tax=Pistacia atlantica TaxID=434234 RepID=A0ACC1BGE5_9ROSI|nr:hypothetical protein Patl1_28585 [Pistacia atlantica]